MLNQGLLSFVSTDKIVFAWPMDLPPKSWTLSNTLATLTNFGATYVSSRGTYMLSYMSTTNRALVSLISSQTDVTSLSS